MEHVSIVCMITEVHLYVDLLADFQDRGVESHSACIDQPLLTEGILFYFVLFCFIYFLWPEERTSGI